VALFRALKAVALKVNSSPFKVNLLASSPKTGKTLRARLSHIRHKNQQKSSFSANGFVSGIQVSFADSQTNSFINRVLSANGLSPLLLSSNAP
jgi:hypothetical protein